MRHGSRNRAVDTGETGVRIALSAAILLSLLASLAAPSNWLWGMSVLRYVPAAAALLVVTLGLAGVWLLPPLTDAAVRRRLAAAGMVRISLLSAAIAGFLFFLFRARTYLLGDGLELLRRLHQGEIPAPRSPLFNAVEPVVYRFFIAVGAESTLAGAALSILCGMLAVGVAVFFLLRVSLRVGAGGVTMAALFLLTGTMQLFFGYVETYPLMAACVLVFHAAAFDVLTSTSDRERRIPRVVAVLALLLGLVAHPFVVAFLPGGIFLLCLRGEGVPVPDRRRLLAIGLVVAAIPVASALLFAVNPGWRDPDNSWRFLAPQEYLWAIRSRILSLNAPRAWADQYRVFSVMQLSDAWNSLWLSGGVAFAFGMAAVSRRALRAPATWFGLAGFVAMLLIRLMWRTPLGAMRDWDLFSGLGFAAAGLAGALVLSGGGRRMALPATAAGLALLVPWIGVQVSPEAAARRHIDGVEAEPRPEPYVAAGFHNAMGDRFLRLREYDLAASAYARAVSASPRYEFAWRLGTVQLARGRYAEAAAAFEKALELHPGDVPATLELATALIGLGNPDRARVLLDGVLERHPDVSGAWLRRARAEFAAGRIEEGLPFLAEAERRAAPDSPDARDIEELKAWLETTRPAAAP